MKVKKMYERIIKNSINYLNKYLTKGFLETKNIIVSIEEAEIITNIIKNNWEDLYHNKYEESFKILKSKVKKETYEKVLSLYLTIFH